MTVTKVCHCTTIVRTKVQVSVYVRTGPALCKSVGCIQQTVAGRTEHSLPIVVLLAATKVDVVWLVSNYALFTDKPVRS